jgi:hypothetical protein
LIRHHLPHILGDSSHLVKLIEAIDVPHEFSTSSFRLLTGDVEGLFIYANIPIEEAISRVTSFVHNHTDEFFSKLISLWLTFGFEEALVHFGQRTFRQTWGFPTGTALSPDAANIFMAICEDVQGIYQHSSLTTYLPDPKCSLLFARQIDDYTIILAGVDDSITTVLRNELDDRVWSYLRCHVTMTYYYHFIA